MAVDRKEANLKKLKEADKVQEKTKEAIWRIQRQAAEAEELGTQTLDELRRQGQQMVCFTHFSSFITAVHRLLYSVVFFVG
jgi:hypothetical protein